VNNSVGVAARLHRGVTNIGCVIWLVL
jgi:hypothetical protein